MYGNTEQMAEAIAASLADNGIKNIVMHNVSKSPSSYILKDVFKYKGVIVGSPTYSNQLFPEVEAVLSKIELREVKNRIFGYFGSLHMGWSRRETFGGFWRMKRSGRLSVRRLSRSKV